MNTKIRDIQHRVVDSDVYDYFNNMIGQISSSGEASDVKFVSYDSSEPPCPIGPGQFTKLKLTDNCCNLTSFTDSFINLKIKTTLHLNFNDGSALTAFKEKWNQNANSLIKAGIGDKPFLFVGFKSGIQAIDHYRFYCSKGRGYVCEQSQALYESTITWFAKAQEEIDNKMGCYTTYDDILKMNQNVSGVYLTLNQIYEAITTGGNHIDVEFDIIVKYDDFAPLQYFKAYPNTVCGDLQMEFKINNMRNMVCCPVPPSILMNSSSSDGNTLIQAPDKYNNFSIIMLGLSSMQCSKEFINIGRKFISTIIQGESETSGSQVVDTYLEAHTLTGDITAESLTLQVARSYINGYNINESKLSQIRDLLSTNKLYIPAQRIDQYSFSQLPTSTSMNCNTTQTLTNCSSLIFTWPRSTEELTCSKNPLCSSIQLQLDNKTFPDKPFSTYELPHSNYILSNLMFDDFFTPNKALYRSLYIDPAKYDDTNYMFVVATERLDSDPFVFDGITKDNCFITLNGTFGQNSPYSRCTTRQNPIMFVCQDTVWELSSEGINYYYNDRNIIPSISK